LTAPPGWIWAPAALVRVLAPASSIRRRRARPRPPSGVCSTAAAPSVLALRGASALAAGAGSSAAEGGFFIAAGSQIASSHLRRSALVLWSSAPAVSDAW